jgi:hypothetical protein
MRDGELIKRIWARIEVSEQAGCWEWQGSKHNRSGHGRMRLPGAKKMVYVHRLMYELFKGPIPELDVVRHRCDNACCCRPAHLELGSVRENAQDRLERGRYGNQLDEYTVTSIRIDYWKGFGIDRLSWDYSVSRSTIYDVINYRTWKHVQ